MAAAALQNSNRKILVVRNTQWKVDGFQAIPKSGRLLWTKLILVPWDELQYADEVHWCISGTPFYFFIYLISFISDQKENSSCAPRLCCDTHQAFANLCQIYQSLSWLWITRANWESPGSMSQCCRRAQVGNTLSWFLCFEEMEEGTVALCRRQTLSDTVYGQWGVRRKATELRGGRGFQNHWAIFIPVPRHSSLPQGTGHTSLLRKLCPWRDACPTASPRQGCCTSLGRCCFSKCKGGIINLLTFCCRIKGSGFVWQLLWLFVFF